MQNPNAAPPISNNRRRLLTTPTTPSPASTTTPSLLKRTRFSPDLTLCHSCDIRFPSNTNSSRNRLRLLRSRWRVALLCPTCLSSVAKSKLCSYCFENPSPSRDLTCRSCGRLVHVQCAAREHRSVTPRSLEEVNFVCVDCCFSPGFRARARGSKLKTRICVEDVAENAVAEVREKEIADKTITDKTITDKNVAENGESDSDGGVGVGVRDEEMALRLHLSMNGSSRITRNLRLFAEGKAGNNSAVQKCSDVIRNVEVCGQDGNEGLCEVSIDGVDENGKEEENDGNGKLGEDRRGKVVDNAVQKCSDVIKNVEECRQYGNEGFCEVSIHGVDENGKVEENGGNGKLGEDRQGKVVDNAVWKCLDVIKNVEFEACGNDGSKGLREEENGGNRKLGEDRQGKIVDDAVWKCLDVIKNVEFEACGHGGSKRLREEENYVIQENDRNEKFEESRQQVKEEQLVLNLQGVDCGIDSVVVYKRKKRKGPDGVVVLENREGDGGCGPSELQVQEVSSVPDRFMKKYCKRPPKAKEVVDGKDERLIRCSGCSNALTTFGDGYLPCYCGSVGFPA